VTGFQTDVPGIAPSIPAPGSRQDGWELLRERLKNVMKRDGLRLSRDGGTASRRLNSQQTVDLQLCGSYNGGALVF
jgi:hypothetical protein